MKLLLVLGLLGGLFGCVLCAGGGAVWYFVYRGSAGDDMRYLPDNCGFLTVVQVDELKASSAYAEAMKCPGAKERLGFFKLPGGKPLDITRAVTARAGAAEIHIWTMKRPATIQDFIEGNAKPRESQVNGKTIYELGATAYHIDGKHVINGPAEQVRAILQRAGEPRLSDNMKRAMREVDFSRPLVAAADVAAMFGAFGGAVNATGDLPLAFAADSDFRMPMSRRVKIICRDAAAAAATAAKFEKDKAVVGNKMPNATVRISGSMVIITGTSSDTCGDLYFGG